MDKGEKFYTFAMGLFWGVIVTAVSVALCATKIDPDLQKIQRQRNAMRLYEEASK